VNRLVLFAEQGGLHNSTDWSVGGILIAIIIVAGMCAVVWVVLKAMGVQIPMWVVHVLWIVFAVIIGVVAIKFLISMW
jgi:uncharacterized protein (DUF983 family)